MIFYFSGTGNSAWVARRLAEATQDVAYSITEALRNPQVYSLSSDEALGFVFPVYAWAPPAVVLHFVQQMQQVTPPAYVYFVCTCGDDTGRTAQVFASAVRRKGWLCVAGWSVTMPNTYVALPGFDVDDADLEEQKVSNAKERVHFIATEIARRVRMKTFNCHEGVVPFTKTYLLRPLFQAFLMSPRPFHATDVCVGCGKCERVCPMQNIRLTDSRPIWENNCAQCLACYHACPVHAVAYGQRTRGKGQYRRFL